MPAAAAPSLPTVPEINHLKSDAIILLSRLRTRQAELQQAQGDIDEWDRRIGFQKSNGTRAVQEKLGELTGELEARVKAVMEHLDSEEGRLLQPLHASRAVLDGHVMETERAMGMLERATEPDPLYDPRWNPVVHEQTTIQSSVQLAAAIQEVQRVLQLEVQVVNWPTNGGMNGPDPAVMVGLALNDRDKAAAMLSERAEAAETINRLHDSIDELKAVSGACTGALQEQVDGLRQEIFQSNRRIAELENEAEQARERAEQTKSEHTAELGDMSERVALDEAKWQQMLGQQEDLTNQGRAHIEELQQRCLAVELEGSEAIKKLEEASTHERVCTAIQKTSLERAIEQQTRQLEDSKEDCQDMSHRLEASIEYTQLLEKGLQSMTGQAGWYGEAPSAQAQTARAQSERAAHREYLYSVASAQNGTEVITRHQKLESEKSRFKNPIGQTKEVKKKKRLELKKKQEAAAAAEVVMPQVALVAENERLRRMMGAGLGSRMFEPPPQVQEPQRRLSEPSERRAPSTTAGKSSERSISPRSDSVQPVWQEAVSHEYDKLLEEYLQSDATPDALKSVLMNQGEKLRQRADSVSM